VCTIQVSVGQLDLSGESHGFLTCSPLENSKNYIFQSTIERFFFIFFLFFPPPVFYESHSWEIIYTEHKFGGTTQKGNNNIKAENEVNSQGSNSSMLPTSYHPGHMNQPHRRILPLKQVSIPPSKVLKSTCQAATLAHHNHQSIKHFCL
jgi:hypothetical protein